MYSPSRVFAAACAGMTLFGMAMLSLGTVNTFLAVRFSLDQLGVGSLAALLPFGILTGSLIFGPVVDRFGYKVPLIISALVLSAGLLMVARGESFPIIQGAFFVIGLGGGVLNGGTNALVADISGDNRSARLSLLGVFFGVGALGMPALTGLLLRFATPIDIISWFSAAVLLPVVYMLLIQFPSPKQRQGFPLAQAMTLVRDRTLLLLAMVLFFESAAEGLVSNWTPSFLQTFGGLEPEFAILMLTALSASLTAARLVLGWALRKAQAKTVLFGCLATAGAGAFLLAISTNGYIAATAMILLGIGFAAAFPVIISFIAELFPGLTGTAIGIALLIALTGNMLINYGLGVVSQSLGIGVFPVYLIGVLLGLTFALLIAMKNYALRRANFGKS